MIASFGLRRIAFQFRSSYDDILINYVISYYFIIVTQTRNQGPDCAIITRTLRIFLEVLQTHQDNTKHLKSCVSFVVQLRANSQHIFYNALLDFAPIIRLIIFLKIFTTQRSSLMTSRTHQTQGAE